MSKQSKIEANMYIYTYMHNIWMYNICNILYNTYYIINYYN